MPDPTPELLHRIADALHEVLEARGSLERCEIGGGTYDMIKTARHVLKAIDGPTTPVSFRPQ